MGKPVDRDKIIYGFHYYLTSNAGSESENNPKVVVKKINKSEYSNPIATFGNLTIINHRVFERYFWACSLRKHTKIEG